MVALVEAATAGGDGAQWSRAQHHKVQYPQTPPPPHTQPRKATHRHTRGCEQKKPLAASTSSHLNHLQALHKPEPPLIIKPPPLASDPANPDPLHTSRHPNPYNLI